MGVTTFAAIYVGSYEVSLKVFEISGKKNIRTVDFPSISTGVYRYPLPLAATVALKAIMDFLSEHDLPERVRMVCHTEETARVYRQTWNLWFAGDKNSRI